MNDQSENDMPLQGSAVRLSDEGDGMPAAAAQIAGTSAMGSAGSSPDVQQSSGTADSGHGKPSLRDELAQFKSELDVLVSHASSLSERELGEAYAKLMARFQTYRSKAIDMASTAQQQLNQRVDLACEHVKEKPMQSVAFAAGAGMLVGMVMRRRRADQRR